MVTGKHYKPTKFVRFGLYPVVAVFFFLVLAVVLVIANGHRITFTNGKIGLTKTGMLIVTSRPFDGQITINNKINKKKSGFFLLPTKISGLLPGTYDIEVSKDGYRTWRNRLEIFPNMVTWANYILLFPNKLNITEVDVPEGEIIAKSDNGRHVLFKNYIDGRFGLEVLDTNNLSIKKIWPNNDKITRTDLISPEVVSAKFSDNGDKVILEVKAGAANELIVVDASGNDSKLISLTSDLKTTYSDYYWNQVNDNELYLRISSKVYLVDINNPNLNKLIANDVVYLHPDESRKIFYINKSTEGVYSLKQMLPDGGEQKTVVEGILPSSSYSIKYSQGNMVALLNKDAKSLFVYYIGSSGKKEAIHLSDGVNGFEWSGSGEKMFYYGDNFVKRYDWEKEKEITVSLNNSPAEINWFFDDNHYLVKDENGVFIMDFDGSNQIMVASGSVKDLVLDMTSSDLIYSTSNTSSPATYFKYNSEF